MYSKGHDQRTAMKKSLVWCHKDERNFKKVRDYYERLFISSLNLVYLEDISMVSDEISFLKIQGSLLKTKQWSNFSIQNNTLKLESFRKSNEFRQAVSY